MAGAPCFCRWREARCPKALTLVRTREAHLLRGSSLCLFLRLIVWGSPSVQTTTLAGLCSCLASPSCTPRAGSSGWVLLFTWVFDFLRWGGRHWEVLMPLELLGCYWGCPLIVALTGQLLGFEKEVTLAMELVRLMGSWAVNSTAQGKRR